MSPNTKARKVPPAPTSSETNTHVKPSRSSQSSRTDLTTLQDEWRTLYAEALPAAARSKAPSQPKWPVTLDHCFARIILDNAIGKDRPWMEAVKSPAIKHMNAEQLTAAIDLGTRILDGEVSVVDLDEWSLTLRGKKSKATTASMPSKKRKREDESSHMTTAKKGKVDIDLTREDDDTASRTREGDETVDLNAMIDGSDKTAFQKLCLKALLQIPAGSFSTYGALAKHLNSSPRAVGNAMRGNPFAPRVPCHRILAADRSIGGFGGSWGADGKHVNEKLELLRAEGVEFDSKGKVLGPIFTGFH